MTNNPYNDALQTYHAAIKTAVEFHDANWTNSAITRERARRVEAAQTALKAAVDSIPSQADVQDSAPLRKAALDQLRPHDADTVAVANNEWAKAQKLLQAGWSYDQLLRDADRPRLVALLDQLPTELAATSSNPDGIAEEIESLVLARLLELDDPKAQEFEAVRQAAGYDESWRTVLQQSGDGDVNTEAWSALYRSSPDDYRAVTATLAENAAAFEKARALSRIPVNTDSAGQSE